MEVLILSKTKYGTTQVCVGGICINSKRFVRLLNQGGYYQPANTSFNIGDIWDISFTQVSQKSEPHNEDVTIHNYSFIRKIYSLETYIKSMGVPVWRDGVTNIFDGKLKWANSGKGYLSENINDYPAHSVGFWIADSDLRYQNGYYVYARNGVTKQIVYKGNQTVLQTIPRGKLIRLSLAKWWKPDDSDVEKRCYLQLSGWYDDAVEPQKVAQPKPIAQPSVSSRSAPVVRTSAPVTQKVSIVERQVPKPEPSRTTPPQSSKNTDGPCYIATLCYEDYYADEVCHYRDFRDNFLSKFLLGKLFIRKYYAIAPFLVRHLENHKPVNFVIRSMILDPTLLIIKAFKLHK